MMRVHDGEHLRAKQRLDDWVTATINTNDLLVRKRGTYIALLAGDVSQGQEAIKTRKMVNDFL